jgi:hypothetical protein
MAFPTEVKSSGDAVVDATLDTYRAAMKVLSANSNQANTVCNLTDHLFYSIGIVAHSTKESLHFQLARLQPYHPGSSALQTIGVVQQGGADSTVVSRGLESIWYSISWERYPIFSLKLSQCFH